jgi:hypothetical protein
MAKIVGGIKVRTYMFRNVADHVDPLTGEVNATALAEDAFFHFHPNPADVDIPDDYFLWAEDIATAHEYTTGAREPKISQSIGGVINTMYIPGKNPR